MPPGVPVAAPDDHAVMFYDDESEIVAAVAAYAHVGLQAGESVLLIATAAHRRAILEALRVLGTDGAAATEHGVLHLHDAASTLAAFRPGGELDLAMAEAQVREVVASATVDGTRLRIFGEMVSLLWEEGDIGAALQLESVWNTVLEGRPFGLLCSYPTSLLAPAGLPGIRRTCALHSEVHSPAAYGSDRPLPEDPGGRVADLATAQRTEVFVPTSTAVMAARRFVLATLEDWGLDDLAPDALLLVSEMATNAVLHAASPFRVFLHHSPGVLHLSVHDAQRGWFTQGHPSDAEVSGRGVSIVEAVASRWGCDAVSDGKVVWAELPTRG